MNSLWQLSARQMRRGTVPGAKVRHLPWSRYYVTGVQALLAIPKATEAM
jgi:hypothetical protein